MISLQPSSPAEFEAYRDFIASDESADRVAREETDRLLPDGPATKNQHLLSIKSDSEVHLGIVWLTVIERNAGREAFILDFVVFPQFRRRGYARETMPLVEQYAEGLGLSKVSLSVSADNEAARALYDATGYAPVFTRMTKTLNTPNKSVETTSPVDAAAAK